MQFTNVNIHLILSKHVGIQPYVRKKKEKRIWKSMCKWFKKIELADIDKNMIDILRK